MSLLLLSEKSCSLKNLYANLLFVILYLKYLTWWGLHKHLDGKHDQLEALRCCNIVNYRNHDYRDYTCCSCIIICRCLNTRPLGQAFKYVTRDPTCGNEMKQHVDRYFCIFYLIPTKSPLKTPLKTLKYHLSYTGFL